MSKFIALLIAILPFGLTPAAMGGEVGEVRAAKILLKRGFSPKMAASVLQESGHYSEHALDYLAKRARMDPKKFRYSIPDGWGDLRYDVVSGTHLMGLSYPQFARKVSKCYRRTKPWSDCKLRYQQKDGCYMTKRWKKLCANYNLSSEMCWGDVRGDVRGDIAMLPASVRTQIILTRAKRLRGKRAGRGTRKARGNFLNRVLCPETNKHLFPGRGISIKSPKLNGRRLHWCLQHHKGCGRPTAQKYCETKGFKRVAFMLKQRNIHSAIHLGNKQSCSGGCTGFAIIECDQPKGRS